MPVDSEQTYLRAADRSQQVEQMVLDSTGLQQSHSQVLDPQVMVVVVRLPQLCYVYQLQELVSLLLLDWLVHLQTQY